MFISDLNLKLIEKMSKNLQEQSNSSLIEDKDIYSALVNLKDANSNENYDKYYLVSSLETLYYCFSVMLSEVRQKKREITTALFEQNPKLAQEKSVLKEKLDAEPEYAVLHKNEEQLFQFIEHIQNIKNNIIYLCKEDVEQ